MYGSDNERESFDVKMFRDECTACVWGKGTAPEWRGRGYDSGEGIGNNASHHDAIAACLWWCIWILALPDRTPDRRNLWRR